MTCTCTDVKSSLEVYHPFGWYGATIQAQAGGVGGFQQKRWKEFSLASWCVAAPPRRVRVHLPHLCSWALLCISLRIFAVDLCLASFGALLWLAVSEFSGSCSTSGWPFCQLETFIAVLVGFQLVTIPVLSSTPCGAIIQCPFTLSPFCTLQIIFDWPGRRLWF